MKACAHTPMYFVIFKNRKYVISVIEYIYLNLDNVDIEIMGLCEYWFLTEVIISHTYIYTNT